LRLYFARSCELEKGVNHVDRLDEHCSRWRCGMGLVVAPAGRQPAAAQQRHRVVVSGMAAPASHAAAAFYEQHAATRWLRGSLQGMQRLSPGLAARAAQALFCTPLPPKLAARRLAVPAGWTVQRWPFERASLTLYRPHTPPPDAPVVLLAHGWGGHGLQWSALAQRLLERGLAPVLLDFPAHGRSDGWRATLPQFARALDYVAHRLAPHALVAHSLGATAAAYACTRAALVQRLVLAAPAGSPLNFTRGFAAVFGLTEAARSAMQQRIESSEAVLMAQFEAAALAPRLACPVLVVHDQDDRVNPVSDGRLYAEAPAARLVVTRGLGHRRLLADAAVIEQIAAFVGA
jgi:pimeloyl-ACP methyl ester carboxylesterase